MMHSFDVDHAVRFGVLEAILIHHFQHWTAKNAANGVNQHDGYTWTYNSVRAYGELFPYFTPRQIQLALKHLVKAGILQTGHYSEDGRDRTNWYSFTKNADEILAVSIMQNLTDALCKNVKCNVQKCQMSNVLRNTLLSTTSNIPTDGEEEDYDDNKYNINNNRACAGAGAREYEEDDPFPPRTRELDDAEARDYDRAVWLMHEPENRALFGTGWATLRRAIESDAFPLGLYGYAIDRTRQRNERCALGNPAAYTLKLLQDWTDQGFIQPGDVPAANFDWGGHYA